MTSAVDRSCEHATIDSATGVFRVDHHPLGPRRASLVVCSPLAAENDRNYRREVLLARRLAGDGIAVTRFHPRGTGNSVGEPSCVSFESLVADALTIAGGAAELGEPTGFLGTRIGALVAAHAAATTGSFLVEWCPVDGTRFLRDASRAEQLRWLAQSGRGDDGAAPRTPPQRLGRARDVLGYVLHPRMIDSSLRAAEQPSAPVAENVLLELGRSPGQATLDLATRWSATWSSVTTAAVDRAETWWFFGEALEVEETRPLTVAMIETT